MDVDTLVFTGSTKIAKQLMIYAGESNMKRVWLEAGGKSPNIVFADAPDLDAAAASAASAIAFNQEPTVFDNVNNEMPIAREEIFGPVLSVITFETPEQAIAIANDTDYGLAAAVWTSDISKAHKTAKALRTGMVWINHYDGGDMTAPFGGYKQSGNGRDKSLHAFEKYTEVKATWIAF
eukprot:snap_masked-scaffold883_size84933-processed-gene-0.1 protein:Tk06595 transcript:snap_masked-scaffold883_size84933-processed-gene-0.1-mRNA-1 annotation:"aldehyde dehydrogenase"